MKIIRSIKIKYFRSILNTTRGNITELPISDLNIIVGSNDAGKSNYLRALNLFFNNEPEPGLAFEFWSNFSNQRHGKRREENRIEIELVIDPPENQQFKNKGAVRWKKTWRENSKFPEEKIEYLNGADFTNNNRSGYYKWLKKIKFKYVPAIKSEDYFNKLMLDLYDVLEEDANSLEKEFNKQIRSKTEEISKQINERLNIESILQFKGSFKDLFNRLEFGSGDSKLMLSQRGDGVKVRHIPIMLQNMADAELKEDRMREPIASTIWGFEEPENNLEYDAASRLSEQFIEYISSIHFSEDEYSKYDEGVQIFITTHSPIFYTLGKRVQEKSKTYFIYKGDDNSSNVKLVEDNGILEKEMKLLPMIQLSKYWEEINSKIKIIKKEKEELEEAIKTITNNKKCLVLTEDSKKNLLKILLLANGFQEGEFEIISYKGCSKLDSAKLLGNYLRDKFGEGSPQVIVHRDKDYLHPADIENDKNKFSSIGMKLFITRGTDVESYFTNLTFPAKITH